MRFFCYWWVVCLCVCIYRAGTHGQPGLFFFLVADRNHSSMVFILFLVFGSETRRAKGVGRRTWVVSYVFAY